MTDPVSSFLRGFQVVNQLETNRVRRKAFEQQMEFAEEDQEFKRENQSRIRTLWERETKEYEKQQLDQYRAEKLAEFDATVKQIVSEVPETEIDQWFTNAEVKNGKPAGFTRVANEALKRMVAADPEFGEHLAKSVGIDPASGPFIRDKRKPVSGVGILPSSLAPNGKGGLFFEVDSVNGMQPLTERRSADPDDNVFIGEIGLPELTKAFGQNVMGNDLLIAQQLRRAVGADRPTGNPLASQERTAPPVTSESPVLDSQKVPRETPEQFEARTAQEGKVLLAEQQTALQERADRLGITIDELKKKTGGRPFFNGAPEDDPLLPENAKSTARVAGEGLRERISDAASRGFLPDPEAVPRQETKLTPFGEKTRDFLVKQQQNAKDFLGGLLGTNKKPVEPITAVPTTPAVISSNNQKPADFTAAKVTKDPEAAIAKGSVPANQPVAEQIAQRLLAIPRRKRPSIVDTYNAVSLAKAQVITPAQLMRYTDTGEFDAPARKQLQNLGGGNFVLFDPETGAMRFGKIPGTAETESDIDIFKDQRTLIENFPQFQDDDGKVDKGKVQVALNQVETASDVLESTGIIKRKDRTNRSLLNSLIQGQRMVDNFDPDTSQTFDFNPFSDPELGPNNMALGFVADQFGITNQKDADRFLFDYGITFRSAFPNMKSEDIIRNVIAMESKAKSSNKMRREIVEATIEKARRGP